MRFSKWHALGNSYLLVERAELGAPLASWAAERLCDPHTGVGSDGVLEVVSVDGAECEVVIWNPDGSTAELSGNGTRITAAWLLERAAGDEIIVRVGDRRVGARRAGAEIVTDVGPVEVGPAETIDVEGEDVEVTPVRVGNPHAVVVREPTGEALRRLGPLLERHRRFPERTNVQLVRFEGSGAATALVWERGAGETPTSGTSAVAVAAAGIAAHRLRSPVVVTMPGGDVVVEFDGEWNARLRGPAEKICDGDLAPSLLIDAR